MGKRIIEVKHHLQPDFTVISWFTSQQVFISCGWQPAAEQVIHSGFLSFKPLPLLSVAEVKR